MAGLAKIALVGPETVLQAVISEPERPSSEAVAESTSWFARFVMSVKDFAGLLMLTRGREGTRLVNRPTTEALNEV